jgi:hypothetical protein
MAVQPDLIIPRQQGFLSVFRRFLDGFAIQIDENFPLAPTDALDPFRRNEDFFARPPVVSVNDEITNRPRLIINDEILDVANLTVQDLDVMAAHTVSAAQMVIP